MLFAVWALSHLSIRYGGVSLWKNSGDEDSYENPAPPGCWHDPGAAEFGAPIAENEIRAAGLSGGEDGLYHRGLCATRELATAWRAFLARTSVTDHPPGFTIAVVDDDQRILESLENLLESADYAVRPFASGAALLGSGCLAEIDCLISDIDMPVVDGFELLRVVRAARTELPVILITGHPEMLNRLPPIGPGHYHLFKKPFNGQELLTAISDALRNPPLRGPKS